MRHLLQRKAQLRALLEDAPTGSFDLKKIIEFKNKEIIEHDVDPLFSQKIGLSLRCDPKGRSLLIKKRRDTFG
jgi:hypothetical protein